jgi:L-rhamnose mutarotase
MNWSVPGRLLLSFFACTFVAGCSVPAPSVCRLGRVAKVRIDKLSDVEELCNELSLRIRSDPKDQRMKVRNHSVWLKNLEPGQPYLFEYFEHTGRDLKEALAEIQRHPVLGPWQRESAECLESHTTDPNVLWADMEEVFYYEGAADVPLNGNEPGRHAQVIGLKPDMVEPYKYIHANTWSEVLAAIKAGNIRNYPIFLTRIGPRYYLFAYFEYVGKDFEVDMATIEADSATQAWTKFTDDGCQLRLSTASEGEWWAEMKLMISVP